MPMVTHDGAYPDEQVGPRAWEGWGRHSDLAPRIPHVVSVLVVRLTQHPVPSVSKCEELDFPGHVLSNCSHPLGNFSFNSKCSFRCASGYVLSGPRELECLASGMWTSKPPECTGRSARLPPS